MDIIMWILFIAEAILGVASSIGIVVILIGTLGTKIVNKIKYGKSLYD